MNLEEIQQRTREIFRLEAGDLLRELEEALLALEADPMSAPLVHRVFRVMHTLKGSGATSGFQELSDFVHRIEDVFNAAREGRATVTSAMIDTTLRISDAIARHLKADAAEATGILEAARDDLNMLLACLPESGPAPSRRDAAQIALPDALPASRPVYRIRFRPHAELFRSGGDPGMYLDDLRALGDCTVRGFGDLIPPLADMDPLRSYLRWEIELVTDAGENAIREVFAFIEGECDLQIDHVPAPLADARTTWVIEFVASERTLSAPGVLESLWRDLRRFGELEIRDEPAPIGGRPAPGRRLATLKTHAPAESIQGAFVFLMDAAPNIRRESDIASAEPNGALPGATAPVAGSGHTHGNGTSPAITPEPVSDAARRVERPRTATAAHVETLRVSADRLDRLVNLVGELVILRSQVSTACASANLPPALSGAAEALQSLSTEMRDVVLNIRMMPVEQTFAKHRRLVRDLARDLGKEVHFAVEGGATEMDKTVLDALADPLVHLVRNSLDHGLEPAAERVAAGKSAHGTLTLRAEQCGDRVVVTVRDDGRGLDPAKIRAKAVDKGLIAADANPTEAELFQVLFLPGFSTAPTVSQVSGRGVGLDVVRRQIEQLRGHVEVRTERGCWTEFRLSLPLTLAIIEGLLVEVDGDQYVLPLGIAREAIALTRAARTAGNARNLIAVRGEVVPYVRLRDVFRFSSEPPDPEQIVIVEVDKQRIGLVVDRVVGNHQTVLKSLGWVGRRVNLFSGATVLGNGHIALILDAAAILKHCELTHTTVRGLEI